MTPPLFDFDCTSCHHRFEALVRGKDEWEGLKCPKCGHSQLQVRVSALGGYSIKGNNSASVTPKNAGSKGHIV